MNFELNMLWAPKCSPGFQEVIRAHVMEECTVHVGSVVSIALQ